MSLINLEDGVVAGAYGEIAYADGWTVDRVLKSAVALIRADDAVRLAISENQIGLHGCFCAARMPTSDGGGAVQAHFIGSGPGPDLPDLSPETDMLLNALAVIAGLRDATEARGFAARPPNGPRIAISWYPLDGIQALAAERNARRRRADDEKIIANLREAANRSRILRGAEEMARQGA